MTRKLILVIVLLFGCGGAPASPGGKQTESRPTSSEIDGLRYRVSISENLSVMNVRTCFGAKVPLHLRPMAAAARQALVMANTAESAPLRIGKMGIELSRVKPFGCIEYRVDLDVVSAGRESTRNNGELFVPHTSWLLRPTTGPRKATLTFALPAGMHVSVPFFRTGDTYLLEETAFSMMGSSVFSRSAPTHFDVATAGGNVAVELVVLRGELDLPKAALKRSLTRVIQAVSTLSGKFPKDRVHIVVSPNRPGKSAVAFGMVRRGGGPSVLLLVNQNATEDGLASSWTAVHEFSHLLFPFLGNQDRWLGEGIATYYQEVLRVRAGLQTEKQMWENMLAGFERGRRGGTGRTLNDEARDMMQTYAFRRVYWSGAVFALAADLMLRKRGTSLDEAISKSDWGHTLWQARACLHQLDQAVGIKSGGVSDLGKQYAAMQEFPDVAKLLADLGVKSDGSVDDTAPFAEIRKSIVGRQTSEQTIAQ